MSEHLPSPPPVVTIHWPNGRRSQAPVGTDWLQAAADAGMTIPTGCQGGSCGACEIDVNGQAMRACITAIYAYQGGELTVELASDPYW